MALGIQSDYMRGAHMRPRTTMCDLHLCARGHIVTWTYILICDVRRCLSTTVASPNISCEHIRTNETCTCSYSLLAAAHTKRERLLSVYDMCISIASLSLLAASNVRHEQRLAAHAPNLLYLPVCPRACSFSQAHNSFDQVIFKLKFTIGYKIVFLVSGSKFPSGENFGFFTNVRATVILVAQSGQFCPNRGGYMRPCAVCGKLAGGWMATLQCGLNVHLVCLDTFKASRECGADDDCCLLEVTGGD